MGIFVKGKMPNPLDTDSLNLYRKDVLFEFFIFGLEADK